MHRIFVDWEPNCPTQIDKSDRYITRLTVAFWNFMTVPKKKGSMMEERMERNMV